MKKNKIQLVILFLLILAAFIVISFALPFEKNGLFWVAFLFGIVSIVFQVYAYYAALGSGDTAKSRFYGFPIIRIAAIYVCVQLVLSILFMALAKLVPMWVGLVLFTLLFIAAMIGLISASAVRDEVEQQDEKVRNDTTVMKNLQSKTAALAGQTGNPEIRKVAEAFRYSDPLSNASTMETEQKLSELVETLCKDKNERHCKEIIDLLAERNILCREGKRQ